MVMNTETECSFKVLPPAADGKEMQMNYTKMNTTINNSLLSTKVSDSISKAIEQKLLGKSIILKLDSNSQVKEVIGFDTLIMSNQDPSYRQIAKQLFSKDQLNDLFAIMFSAYPKKSVKIGDSWNAHVTKDINGFLMTVNLTYTLTKVENGIANISLDGIIDSKGDIGDYKMPISMNGTEKGTVEITLATGYLHSSAYDMNIDGNIEAGDQKVPMKIKATFIMTGK